ncbi:MAPEG family protein [Echinimonas agarilytica]|uniref:MAPEG family protein n=1 Tax=Echinimonas agarilytica TaxID=1215918 RepID=A0AA41W488_9GAMM|nr:MAPEG family protein [Echinimonas agarilytica]MCM2678552.1 MAPEG family protein [Echinimonas agarilytica]
MLWIALITCLILITYVGSVLLVGYTRVKTGIKAPATTGDERFEIAYRCQMNTLEQMVVAIPSMWLLATYQSVSLAIGLGTAFIIGRVIYIVCYVRDPNSRAVGFSIGFLASMAMLIGAIYGIIRSLV